MTTDVQVSCTPMYASGRAYLTSDADGHAHEYYTNFSQIYKGEDRVCQDNDGDGNPDPDLDHDGVSDIVQDSDADGVPDQHDPWPNDPNRGDTIYISAIYYDCNGEVVAYSYCADPQCAGSMWLEGDNTSACYMQEIDPPHELHADLDSNGNLVLSEPGDDSTQYAGDPSDTGGYPLWQNTGPESINSSPQGGSGGQFASSDDADSDLLAKIANNTGSLVNQIQGLRVDIASQTQQLKSALQNSSLSQSDVKEGVKQAIEDEFTASQDQIDSQFSNVQQGNYPGEVTDEEKPSENKLSDILDNLISNNPFSSAISGSTIQLSGEVCSLSGQVYDHQFTISFCDSPITNILDMMGYLIFAVAGIYSFFIVVRAG